MSTLLKHQLPSFYSGILPGKILNVALDERKATCDSCAMARPKNRAKIHYKPELKCCTFHPFLPNFLVGAILLDDSLKAGAEVLREKIRRREYALPIGMVAPVRYQMNFKERLENEFGQREDLLCPYFNKENNNCNVWRYRGVVCTTFFCKSSYGKTGLQFWDRTSDYLSYVEMALMEEALVHLDFSPRQTNHLIEYLNRDKATQAERKTWILPQEKFRDLWNGYHTDIETFYKKTFDIVTKINRKGFQELTGELGKTLEKNLLESYAYLELD